MAAVQPVAWRLGISFRAARRLPLAFLLLNYNAYLQSEGALTQWVGAGAESHGAESPEELHARISRLRGLA